MVKKVLTTLSFIGGRLCLPGEEIDLDDQNPNLVIPAKTTPIGNMTTEELEAYLRFRAAGEKTPADSRNVADPTDQNTGTVAVDLADITVRSPGTTQSQGAPPGAIEHRGVFVSPASPDADAAVETYVGKPGDGGDGSLPQLDHDGNGQPGGSLTKAEIVEALKARGDKVDVNATKAELQSQLSAPPKA